MHTPEPSRADRRSTGPAGRGSPEAAPAKFEAELFAGNLTRGPYCCALRYTFRLKFSGCCSESRVTQSVGCR